MTSQPPDPKEIFNNFVQIGVVVADLDKATKNLAEIFGFGPFRIVEWPPEGREDMVRYYHGVRGEYTARMAFTEFGPVELELIQPLAGVSIWADFLRKHGEGVHHLRFNVADVAPTQEYLAGFGIQPAQHGGGLRPGTTWMNFGSEDWVGFVIEVMNVLPGTDGRTPALDGGKVVE
jgi:methylmalonyl-CoA/ethylmalonyl-CoA epimerase